MRKKEEWMKKGNPCIVNGRYATIAKFEENKGLGMVYYFWVRFEGEKKVIGPYHPSDIQEFVTETKNK